MEARPRRQGTSASAWKADGGRETAGCRPVEAVEDAGTVGDHTHMPDPGNRTRSRSRDRRGESGRGRSRARSRTPREITGRRTRSRVSSRRRSTSSRTWPECTGDTWSRGLPTKWSDESAEPKGTGGTGSHEWISTWVAALHSLLRPVVGLDRVVGRREMGRLGHRLILQRLSV